MVGERGGLLLGLSHGVGLRVVDDLVERQVQQVVAALGVDVDLGDVLHDVAHGVDVESVARDFRSPGVLGLQGGEAVGIASGGLDDAGLIAERLFLEACGGTFGLRDDGVAVGLAEVDRALAVLTGLDGVVEGGLNLLGRLGVLDGDAHDLNAGGVAIEHVLHRLLDGLGDLGLAFEEDAVHCLAADDLAHGGLGGLRHGEVGLADAEDVVARAVARLDAVLDGELHVDDVLVVGEHQGFAQTVGAAGKADFGRANARDVDDLHVLNRHREMPAEAGGGRLGIATERGHDAALAFGHDVEARGAPGENRQAHDHGHADARPLRPAGRLGRLPPKPPRPPMPPRPPKMPRAPVGRSARSSRRSSSPYRRA